MRGIFVTGTDTDVGKTVLAASIIAAATARGMRVAAYKPVVTGLDEPVVDWPRDHELLASVANAGQAPGDVAPYRYGPAVSPHLAARLAGERVDPERLISHAHEQAARADVLVAEGVGGLLVPLADDYLVRDLVGELSMPVVIAARPGLGTISHSLLTVEAARAVALRVQAVVLTPWPGEPTEMHESNRQTIERFAEVPVLTLPATSPAQLGEAAAQLPVSDWLAP